jgi:starch-binding outer membrane protein, SusD/RagB family
MIHHTHRARRAAAAVLVAAPFGLTACLNRLEDNLLEPQQPGVISPEAVANAGAAGANALYVGALGAFQSWTGGGGNINRQNVWMYSDLLADVWKVTDTFSQRIDLDRRTVATNDAEVNGTYNTVQQSRGFYRDAINALRRSLPNEPVKQAEMFFLLGFTEMNMGEVYCNGIPLGETVNGEIRYTAGLTNAQVFQQAITHLDSAITLAAGTSAAAAHVRTAAAVAKGRALVDLGQFAQAAAAVAGVPTSFQYTLTYSQTTQSNAIWTANWNQTNARVAVGDSVTIANGVEVRIRNAIPFGSANDPRVPVTGSYKDVSKPGFDGQTPWVGANIWNTREAPIVIVSGIDARLIEAEAKLNDNDVQGATTTLNALRSTAQTLGAYRVAIMPSLATPAARDAAVDLLFREKAFWQFGRGTRLGDLRRLIRQYGRTEDDTFPEGGFHKTPFTFGNDVNLPVPDAEMTNPNFKGCLNRSA